MKTILPKKSEIKRSWYLLNADGLVVGKIAAKVASILRGKHKPTFTPHIDTGDGVIIINAEKVVFTGKKLDQKKYFRYSRHLGNVKEKTAGKILEDNPVRILQNAIGGMVPRNHNMKIILKRLKIFKGPEHKHTAQSPIPLSL
ncbi:50S ribosomal protein L13 [Candidatus Peregrinibacteria bacterium]|nr:50S ribosomal protein L13 [Candidatus Peregrinibacteria bacterium]